MIEKQAEQAVIVVGLAQAIKKGEEKGYLARLTKSGLSEDHFTGNEQIFYKAAMGLHLQGRTMTSLDLIQQANSSMPPDYWKSIEPLWLNPPALDPDGFIPALKNARAARRVERITTKINQLLKERPHDVHKWLPQATSALQKVSQDSSTYNPDPREIYFKSKLPVPFASTGFRAVDETMLGGWHYGGLGVWYGFTKSSKSTWMYSFAVAAALNGVPSIFIRGERPESEVSTMMLRGLCGHQVPYELLCDKEFTLTGPDANPAYADDPRVLIKEEALHILSEFVTIHPLETATVEELEQIVSIYKAPLVLIDPYERLRLANGSPVDAWKASQATAQAVLDLSSKYSRYIAGSLQLSPKQKLEWLENRDLKEVSGYGTNAWTMKATDVTIVDRHETLPNTGYCVMRYRTRKDGEVHLPYTVRYSPSRGRYIDDDEEE